MPRVDSQAHAIDCSSVHGVVGARDPHDFHAAFDALAALLCQTTSAENEPSSTNVLQREDALALLDALWEYSAQSGPAGPLHFTWDGVDIDIREQPAGLEIMDCASGECRMLYGCHLARLSQACAAKGLGLVPPHDVQSEILDGFHGGATAGNLPQELWETIAMGLHDHADLTALVCTSRQFGQNFSVKARLLRVQAYATFTEERIPAFGGLKAVLTLARPWPYPARIDLLDWLVRNVKFFSDDPDALSLLLQQAREFPHYERRRLFSILASVVSQQLRNSAVLWRECVAELRTDDTVEISDQASALIALAAGFGNWPMFEAPALLKDFDDLFNQASKLAPDDQRKVVSALAGAAPRLWRRREGEIAWTRCVAAIHDLNRILLDDRGAALWEPSKSWIELRLPESRVRAFHATIAEFKELDPADPYWHKIYDQLDRNISSQLPVDSCSSAYDALRSAVMEIRADHPLKARTLCRLMSPVFSGPLYYFKSSVDTLMALVHAVVSLPPHAAEKEYAVLQVLSTICRLPSHLRTSVWEVIYSAVPEALEMADAELQARLRRMLDAAMESLPDQYEATALPHEAKRPRRDKVGI